MHSSSWQALSYLGSTAVYFLRVPGWWVGLPQSLTHANSLTVTIVSSPVVAGAPFIYFLGEGAAKPPVGIEEESESLYIPR